VINVIKLVEIALHQELIVVGSATETTLKFKEFAWMIAL
jgi:hypothetical protein